MRARLFEHRVFLPLLLLAAVLRVVTMLGYQSVMWFPDSYDYVGAAQRMEPGLIRPSGYPLLLWLVEDLHSLVVVAALQHLMGLGVAVMIYGLLRRRFGAPGWVASLAAVPVLFDAFQIQLEHMVLSDTLFVFLVVAAVCVLMGERLGTRQAALAGSLLGLAALTRSVGIPLLMIGVVYLAVRRAGWRPVVTLVATCALPIVCYLQWYNAHHGRLELTRSSGVFLYSRSMAFADCEKMRPPAEEMPLCVAADPDNRKAAGSYVWGPFAPVRRIPGGAFNEEQNRLAGSFAKRAMLAQPGDYLRIVAIDVARTFQWGHPVYPEEFTYSHYLFRDTAVRPPEHVIPTLQAYQPGRVTTKVVDPYAGFMQGYQRHVYLRGSVLGLILAAGLAWAFAGRRRGAGVALLPWSLSGVLIVVPAATAQFDYRYALAAVPLACLAAGAAFCRGGRGAPGAAAPSAGPEDAPADRDTADAAGASESREESPVGVS
ncbi:glycosyltransferase family 39 protein [Thermomonospora umbrina]|uniref:Dolichyl-phosphate-mannose-protein mannosyltransferase n=1 Tax=Thermomonospora umbrina TaxID=111806 RepID=A0A3D9SSP8_9ACTN|nr:glycosyltransferase family 39 protein [Thermomonospora umbrina]REE98972.1 dolichyl-phosphate-mannose-protein mannosyltransferase [Thermomonospora umbrina]